MRIYIDPGHGGRDSGAVGNGLLEKDVVLELALALADRLMYYDCHVLLARKDDVYVDNGERAREANSWGADLYFSIHVNGHTNLDANGYEDFIHPTAPARTQAIQKDIHRPAAEVWTAAGRMNRGRKTANFQVLRETRMSAVLVEHGFISNAKDAALLKDPAFKEKVVAAMEEGIATALDLKSGEAGSEVKTPIIGKPQASVKQAKKWAQDRGAHQRFIDIAETYWQIGQQIGIRPEVAYAQSAKETAFGRYGGVVSPEANNWAGIKIREGGPCSDPAAHESFPTPRAGVRAHFNHLAAYTGLEPIGEPHGRYYLVMSLEWAGTVKYVEDMGGRWAPSPEYGQSVVKDYLEGLLATQVQKPEPKPDPPPGEQPFVDVPDSHWAAHRINSFYKRGLLTGSSDGKLRPDDPATRAEVITLIERAIEYLEGGR